MNNMGVETKEEVTEPKSLIHSFSINFQWMNWVKYPGNIPVFLPLDLGDC